MKRLGRWLAPLAAGAAIWAASAGTAAADPWNIRIGWVTIGHVQPIIDLLQKRHPELFHEFGKSYVAEGVHYQGTSPQIQALAINELEIAAFAPDSLALAADNAHLDVRMIADVFQDGVPGYGGGIFVVRKDSPIKTIDDLRGKIIASNAIGSFSDSAMRVMMRRHGISDRGFTSIEAPFAAMPAMLDEGKIDLAPLLPQYNYMLDEGKYRVLFTNADAEGRVEGVLWAMRASVIAAHRPALVDFLEDHVRALQWLLDPAHHAEAIALAVAVSKQKPETLDYMLTKGDQYHASDGRPDVAATQRLIDLEYKYGLIHETLQVAPHYVDLGPIDEADKRLGGS